MTNPANTNEVSVPFTDPYQFLAIWPQDVPLIAWISHGRKEIVLITCGAKISWQEMQGITWGSSPASNHSPLNTFAGDIIIGAAGYDAFNIVPRGSDSIQSFYLGLNYLKWDLQNEICYYHRGADTRSSGEFSVPFQAIKQLLQKASKKNRIDLLKENSEWDLSAHCQDREYKEIVTQIKNDIKMGRYYQLNFLRFFDASPKLPSICNRKSLATKMAKIQPPYGLWLEDQQHFVFSLSPERFVELSCPDEFYSLSAYPIKGSRSRSHDPILDQKLARELIASEKDLAELHIIVDLLRNDLQPLCEKRSIKVKSAQKLTSSLHIHHLEAEISGLLKTPCTFAEMLSSLCPAGSVTGAPKKEVVSAIETYEKRPRNFFMGNGFYFTEKGELFSTVLIRTLSKKINRKQKYEFAAGSGITIASNPDKECQEIEIKSRILTKQ